MCSCALEAIGRWTDACEGRLRILPGNLAKPKLGLTPEAYEDVANNTDVLFHVGAWVNWLHDYYTLKPINVGGTAESRALLDIVWAEAHVLYSAFFMYQIWNKWSKAKPNALGNRNSTFGAVFDKLGSVKRAKELTVFVTLNAKFGNGIACLLNF